MNGALQGSAAGQVTSKRLLLVVTRWDCLLLIAHGNGTNRPDNYERSKQQESQDREESPIKHEQQRNRRAESTWKGTNLLGDGRNSLFLPPSSRPEPKGINPPAAAARGIRRAELGREGPDQNLGSTRTRPSGSRNHGRIGVEGGRGRPRGKGEESRKAVEWFSVGPVYSGL